MSLRRTHVAALAFALHLAPIDVLAQGIVGPIVATPTSPPGRTESAATRSGTSSGDVCAADHAPVKAVMKWAGAEIDAVAKGQRFAGTAP